METRAHKLTTAPPERTARVETSSAAEAELARLHESLRVAGASLWEYDGDTREMIRVDSGGDELFGLPIADWLDGERRRALRHPDDVDVSKRALARLFGGEAAQVEYETRVKDGTGGWRRLHHTATRAPEPGRPRLIRGFSIDVTARRLYIETMASILQNTNKILIDKSAANSGVVPYLPLQQLQPLQPTVASPPGPPPQAARCGGRR